MDKHHEGSQAISILGQWHATPLSMETAVRTRKQLQQKLYTAFGKKNMRLPQIQMMCARFWQKDFGVFDFELMSQNLPGNRRIQALLHLVYGQLLMARKQEGAFNYLDRGLRLADGIIKAQEYFAVYNRHHSLRSLKLTKQMTEGLTLEQLLNEAAVIDKLSQHSDTEMTFEASQFDTLINKAWN